MAKTTRVMVTNSKGEIKTVEYVNDFSEFDCLVDAVYQEHDQHNFELYDGNLLCIHRTKHGWTYFDKSLNLDFWVQVENAPRGFKQRSISLVKEWKYGSGRSVRLINVIDLKGKPLYKLEVVDAYQNKDGKASGGFYAVRYFSPFEYNFLAGYSAEQIQGFIADNILKKSA